MFATVGTKLKVLMDTVGITNVYNYEKKLADSGYPYITISPTDAENVVETTTQDRVNIGYTITVFVQNKSLSTAEGTIRGYVDTILAKLRTDEYLTGTALRGEFGVEWGWLNDEQPVRVAKIKCNYLLLISI